MNARVEWIKLALAGAVLLAATNSCGGEAEEWSAAQLSEALVPSRGTAETFDVASWNIEWFGSTSNGPSNESLQLQNARDVIAGSDMDIWGLAEIVSTTHFESLKAQLPGYSGFLANAPNVVNGAAYYSDYNGTEQKVGILYKSSLATVLDARIILTAYDSDFAGRPPLQVTFRVTLNGRTEDVVVIVLHAKCCSTSDGWQRRRNASNALKSYLDANHASRKVWVVGDFNDDLDESITSGQPSPYENFVDDGADYAFPSAALTDAGNSSTIGYPDTIDHHLNTNESFGSYVAGSAQVYRVDAYIPSYGSTTSDHYPVLSRYTWPSDGGGSTGDPAQVALNEIGANEPGSSTAGEFIEVVNVGGSGATIAGWTLSDGTSTRHRFATGTVLQPGEALVVFAGASAIPAGSSNAVAASTGSLSLANGGDTVALRDAAGALIQSFTYPSSLANSDGVSMNRSPDGNATGPFVKHDMLSSLSRSPGMRANGATW